MLIEHQFKYREEYLPTPRCRKLRTRDVEGIAQLEVAEIPLDAAPIALIEHGYTEREYRLYDGHLFAKVLWRDKHCGKNDLLPPAELHYYIRGIYDYWNYSKEACAIALQEDASQYLIIDGVVYEQTGEPRYVVMTFGLGHNHGGTALMISNGYNPNISKTRYFNAHERKDAISSARKTALARGDTEYVDSIGHYDIEILIPEAAKCNPQMDHGDGDSFTNSLESLISGSSSAFEAGLLVIAQTAEINKKTEVYADC